MRALRRIATPAGIAAALSGCTYAFEDYLPQATDAGLTTNQDALTPVVVDTGITVLDSGIFETAPAVDTAVTIDTFVADTAVTMDTFVADTAVEDTSKPDTCVCVKMAGINCKEWSPPGCGKD
jgi:hypothetical protein